jgi:hypothetical protein
MRGGRRRDDAIWPKWTWFPADAETRPGRSARTTTAVVVARTLGAAPRGLAAAGWPSGEARVCKTLYTGSIPVPASNGPHGPYNHIARALSSGGERFLDAEEVRGSNPLAPTIQCPGHGPSSYRCGPRIGGSEGQKLTTGWRDAWVTNRTPSAGRRKCLGARSERVTEGHRQVPGWEGERMGGYVLDLREVDQTQVAVVGGKGANLGELSRIGWIGSLIWRSKTERRSARAARRSGGPSKGSSSPTIWRRRSPARLPDSASEPPTPSDRARRRRTCRRPPSQVSRTRT